MPIFSNIHTHTTFSDGKNTPEEVVLSAINLGFKTIGISDHGYTSFDTSYCLQEKDIPIYVETVNGLKEKYKDQIDVYLGIESDFYHPFDKAGLDYTIGGVHYFYAKGSDEYLSLDYLHEQFQSFLYDELKGDERALVREYFSCVTKQALEYKPDIIAHPDLVIKLNAGNRYFDENSCWYKSIIEDTAEKIKQSGCIAEVNTGAMVRGYRDTPYPQHYFLASLNELGVPIIISSDSHNKNTLDAFFPQAVKTAKTAGYKSVMQFLGGKFIETEI